jgi:hypothetical protein
MAKAKMFRNYPTASKYYHSIYLEGLRKTMEDLSWDSWSLDPDLNA